MTLPDEELRALKQTHEFMRGILSMRLVDFRKMGKKGFEEWRTRAYYCIKHYPFDCTIERMWEERIDNMKEELG